MSSAVKSKKRGRPVEGPSIAAEIELALARKKALDGELLNLERQIYALETSYLENTAQLGDLIRGWGDFTNPTSPGGAGGSTTTKKKKKIQESERIFSSSSVSAQKNPEFQNGGGSGSSSSGVGVGGSSGVGYSNHSHSSAHSSLPTRPHSTSNAMDEDSPHIGDDYDSSGATLSLDMDIDTTTPIKHRKSEKKSSSSSSQSSTDHKKKSTTTSAHRSTPKPPKVTSATPASSFLLSHDNDSLGLPPPDDPFDQ